MFSLVCTKPEKLQILETIYVVTVSTLCVGLLFPHLFPGIFSGHVH